MPYTIPSYLTDTDLTVPNAYVALHHILYRAGVDTDRAAYRVYRNAAHLVSKPDKPCGVITVMFDIVPGNGIGFIGQANTALLLLPEMAGAVLV